MTTDPQVLSIQDFLLDRDAGLAAELERHKDRTMTVVSLSGIETITRCGTCPREPTRPCMSLRILALRYAQHPAYLPEWQITPREADRLVPPPYPRIADIPPPGDARRKVLRQFGLSVSSSDFSDQELAHRGIASDDVSHQE